MAPEDTRGESGTRAAAEAGKGSPAEVLLAFLRLGLTSFGGPVAHLGYCRTEPVERRRRLDDRSDADPLFAPACFALLLFARVSPVWVVGVAALAASIIAG